MFKDIRGKIYTYVQMYTSVIREYKKTTLPKFNTLSPRKENGLQNLILSRQERKMG